MTQRRMFIFLLLLMGFVGSWAPGYAQRPPDVEYVPTPQEAVIEMLRLAEVGKDDIVYDLGCGDGRFVITAAKLFGARGVGVDIDSERINDSNENARKAGVTDRVRFIKGDLFEIDFSDATVVALYLLPELNLRLRPKLLRYLKPGTRIVSNEFDMGDWTPDTKGVVRNAKYYSTPDLFFERDVPFYYWVVPAHVAGLWRWSFHLPGAQGDYTLRLNQTFQDIDGTVGLGGERTSITDPRLTGDSLSFLSTAQWKGQQVTMRYSGRIMSDTIQGFVEIQEGPFAGRYNWTAKRAP